MAGHDAMLLFLHESFMAFCEVLTAEVNCWEACKTKLQQLQQQWQEKGLYGANALNTITQYQAQIAWQDMPPDQFHKFYRFVFHICREPGKRNISMEQAVAAWRRIMVGRFRLLDRWSAFAAASQARVVTEDTWRQVLDFSRTVHEDLSNYDPAGAWAVLLDEFVEDMRSSSRRRMTADVAGSGAAAGSGGVCYTLHRGGSGGGSDLLLLGGHHHHHQRCGSSSSAADLTSLLMYGNTSGGGAGSDAGGGGGGGLLGCDSYMTSISPRCGSKRREPDVDVVTEQLSAMPLGSGQHPHAHAHPQLCQQGQGTCVGPGHGHCQGQGCQGHGPGGLHYPHGGCCGHAGLGAGGGGGGGHPDALAKRVCLERQPSQQQFPQALGPGDPHHPQFQHQQDPHQHHHQQQPHMAARGGVCGPGGGDGTGGAAACMGDGGSVGPGFMLSRAPSSGQQPQQPMMPCSAGACGECSEDSQGPVGSAGMEGVQDSMLVNCQSQQHFTTQQPQQQLFPSQPQHCQQRRAIKARRSGVSDIVRTAVSEALGF
ncbi:hypothetical protein Agub_g8074 [Astrephomene gubernaculifera]|uniref:Defective in cullin neddylation protein n=1 Tax=Astrephomene gubernaculifera TaxID=47775 RepID=A0AAD3DR40_9CHLO|nr:hypothetical protein Agub_g8074 [Astrephomene gubernaculifera]